MILLHGTTRQRAESILRAGPDPSYRESQAESNDSGFYMCTEVGPFPLGTPLQYALSKSKLFPNESGPAIVKVNVPMEIIELALDPLFPLEQGIINFEVKHGLEELIANWQQFDCQLEFPI